MAFTKLCFLVKAEDIKTSTVTFAKVKFISLTYFFGKESVSRERMNEEIQERADLSRFHSFAGGHRSGWFPGAHIVCLSFSRQNQ